MSGGSPLASGLSGDPPTQLISQEPNPGVRFEYHLPLGAPRPGFSWSHSSWGDCSAECGGGEGSGLGVGGTRGCVQALALSCRRQPWVGGGQVDAASACHRGPPWGNPGVGGLDEGPPP